MAKGKKTGGRNWKPGQSGNLRGSPGLPKELKESRKLNQIELERIINTLLYLDRSALQEKIQDPKTPMIEMIAASIIAQAATKGDHIRLDFILNRMLGKPKQLLEHTGKDGAAIQTEGGPIITVTLPANGREAKEEDKK